MFPCDLKLDKKVGVHALIENDSCFWIWHIVRVFEAPKVYSQEMSFQLKTHVYSSLRQGVVRVEQLDRFCEHLWRWNSIFAHLCWSQTLSSLLQFFVFLGTLHKQDSKKLRLVFEFCYICLSWQAFQKDQADPRRHFMSSTASKSEVNRHNRHLKQEFF